MDKTKYIGMDVHKETISIAVLDCTGKLVMESIMEAKAATMVQSIEVLRTGARMSSFPQTQNLFPLNLSIKNEGCG